MGSKALRKVIALTEMGLKFFVYADSCSKTFHSIRRKRFVVDAVGQQLIVHENGGITEAQKRVAVKVLAAIHLKRCFSRFAGLHRGAP